jgi:dTDP-4-dehydrorhamnose 3,5-epimerase
MSCIQEQPTDSVRPSAKENGQIGQSNTARTVGNVESHPPSASGFQPVQKTPTIHVSSGFIRGIPVRIQDNQSSSKHTGTLRGLHLQLPPAAQAKLVTVVNGRILDVAVDIRRGSPTFGKYVSTELSSETGCQLYIPVGFAHGFLTLENDVVVMYKASDDYAPTHERGVRWNDPDIAFPWPLKEADIIISDKDRRLPVLKEFASPFAYDGQPLAPLTVLETQIIEKES